MKPSDDASADREEVRYKDYTITVTTHQLADGRFSGEAQIKKLMEVTDVTPQQQAFSTAFEAKAVALQLAKGTIDDDSAG